MDSFYSIADDLTICGFKNRKSLSVDDFWELEFVWVSRAAFKHLSVEQTTRISLRIQVAA